MAQSKTFGKIYEAGLATVAPKDLKAAIRTMNTVSKTYGAKTPLKGAKDELAAGFVETVDHVVAQLGNMDVFNNVVQDMYRTLTTAPAAEEAATGAEIADAPDNNGTATTDKGTGKKATKKAAKPKTPPKPKRGAVVAKAVKAACPGTREQITAAYAAEWEAVGNSARDAKWWMAAYLPLLEELGVLTLDGDVYTLNI